VASRPSGLRRQHHRPREQEITEDLAAPFRPRQGNGQDSIRGSPANRSAHLQLCYDATSPPAAWSSGRSRRHHLAQSIGEPEPSSPCALPYRRRATVAEQSKQTPSRRLREIPRIQTSRTQRRVDRMNRNSIIAIWTTRREKKTLPGVYGAGSHSIATCWPDFRHRRTGFWRRRPPVAFFSRALSSRMAMMLLRSCDQLALCVLDGLDAVEFTKPSTWRPASIVPPTPWPRRRMTCAW